MFPTHNQIGITDLFLHFIDALQKNKLETKINADHKYKVLEMENLDK